MLLERISIIKWRKGEGGLNFGEENNDLKNRNVEEYQVVENTPGKLSCMFNYTMDEELIR